MHQFVTGVSSFCVMIPLAAAACRTIIAATPEIQMKPSEIHTNTAGLSQSALPIRSQNELTRTPRAAQMVCSHMTAQQIAPRGALT